jgi:hypothetical protein
VDSRLENLLNTINKLNLGYKDTLQKIVLHISYKYGISSSEPKKKIIEFLPFIIPIVLLQWSLMVFALVKLLKAEQAPKLLPKWGWLIIIILVNIIGPVVYLMVGRNEE